MRKRSDDGVGQIVELPTNERNAIMGTVLLTHEDCLSHETPPGHPERIARLEMILDRLEGSEFSSLVRIEAPLCSMEALQLCHPLSHIDRIRNAEPARGYHSIDSDTHMSPGSWNAALRAAGACIEAVDRVIGGEAANAFCATRPPGHHAETARAMGFCLFGNVAIGAKHAMSNHGIERVAIVDFDVHHGNGTSDLVWDDENILFASTHEMGIYPGTGAPQETGKHGQIVNKPLHYRSGSREFREAFGEIIDRVDAHRPGLVMISAGFDAHARDPLASLRLEAEDFAWATEQLCDLADTHAGGRVVSALEGGYDLKGLVESVDAHITVLMNRG